MPVRRLQPAFADDRGVITDLLQRTPIDSVTVITCTPGATRGNHYHKESLQFAYVLSGRLTAWSQIPGGPVEVTEVSAGDLIESPPNERHAFQAIEPAVLVVLTRGPRGGDDYETDTFRVPPLSDSPGLIR